MPPRRSSWNENLQRKQNRTAKFKPKILKTMLEKLSQFLSTEQGGDFLSSVVGDSQISLI